jgi:dolichol-phosphate mannosyltransferase|tara:strand:+ start:166 stop:840 length:675 start_codon:yes stop_codon:yes gene_type:complete
MSYSLVIPVYNEGRLLNNLLENLKALDQQIEIIIVDDGSNDETQKILSKIKDHTIVTNTHNNGKGSAIKNGVKVAKNENIILFDGDLEIKIESISELIQKYEKDAFSPITGIRWGKNENLNFELNRLGNYFINNFFNIIYQSDFNDVLCCVKIINKNLFNSLNLLSNGFDIEVEIMAKLINKNVMIREAPVNYNRRTVEEGKKLKISDSLKILKKIILVKIAKK